jgi:hypothetical protein
MTSPIRSAGQGRTPFLRFAILLVSALMTAALTTASPAVAAQQSPGVFRGSSVDHESSSQQEVHPGSSAKLTAVDGDFGDDFGISVASSSDGNTVLVGALCDDGCTGAAYVFTRSGSTFAQRAKLTASDGTAGDYFGRSVAFDADGSTALIGAANKSSSTGAAYVFSGSGSVWTEQAKLTASDGAIGDYFGNAVALDTGGTTALIGASNKNNSSGAAYAFTGSGATWTEQAKLTASDEMNLDGFAGSVALGGDGSTALIGAANKDVSTGAAYVFTRSGSTWTEQAKLTASDAGILDYFGQSVALGVDNRTALIGAIGKNLFTGAAYVFTESGSIWTEQAKLMAGDRGYRDYFGGSVALDSGGSTALIGAFGKQHATGAAYVFTASGSNWSELTKLTARDAAANDSFGRVALSADGRTALVGAPGKKSLAGAAYVYRLE